MSDAGMFLGKWSYNKIFSNYIKYLVGMVSRHCHIQCGFYIRRESFEIRNKKILSQKGSTYDNSALHLNGLYEKKKKERREARNCYDKMKVHLNKKIQNQELWNLKGFNIKYENSVENR